LFSKRQDVKVTSTPSPPILTRPRRLSGAHTQSCMIQEKYF